MSEQPWWAQHGYLAGKPIDGGLWICVAPMTFTFRLMICTPHFVEDFYCYPGLGDALAAYNAWDGHGDPLDGWVKHFSTDRRRPAPVTST
jgi:hypothetical protein